MIISRCPSNLSLILKLNISCSEVWYNVTEAEYRTLERTDESLLRDILGCSSQVTIEMLYLELGVLLIRFIIMIRRILYLEQILKQRPQNLFIYRFFVAQMTEPSKNDRATQVLKDIVEIDLDIELSQIE